VEIKLVGGPAAGQPKPQKQYSKILLEQSNDFIKRILEYFGIGFKRK